MSYSWCSIKDDYKALVGLENDDLLEVYADFIEEDNDEQSPELL